MFKSLPNGIEDFKTIIDNNSYFVDKSLLIKDIINNINSSNVKLIVRPRRFGKTLNQSMLYYFFNNSKEDNHYLFNNLKISSYSEIMQYNGKYPTLFITFRSISDDNFNDALNSIALALCDSIEGILDTHDIKIPDTIIDLLYDISFNKYTYKSYLKALQQVIAILYRTYNEKVVILIDEYDVPLNNAYTYGYYNKMIPIVRNIFTSLLKTNRYLNFSVITGCLRISKENIFTGLNNVEVYNILSTQFSEYYGFTNNEIDELLSYYDITQYKDDIKHWYDGYLFGETEIYNPYSITHCINSILVNDRMPFNNYWVNTSSNSILNKLIMCWDKQVINDIESLINEKTIVKQLYNNVLYSELDNNIDDTVWTILLYTGYLKVLSQYNDLYEVAIPNYEINISLKRLIRRNMIKAIPSTARDSLFNCFINGDINNATILLNKILLHSISCYDSYEAYYHEIMTGLFSCYNDVTVKSNIESGFGRLDLMIYEDDRNYGIIFEFKHAKTQKDLIKLANDALNQINNNHYETLLTDLRVKNILKYGIAFYGKECYIVK